MEKQETLKALINLIDDPDNSIYLDVKTQIISFGEEAIPLLENAWESSFDSLVQDRLENIIHHIQFGKTFHALKDWRGEPKNSLLKGCYIIAQYQYPDLKIEALSEKIEKITQDVWLELNEKLTPLEKIKVLNHIFFQLHGFSGNTTNFHAPENSFLNLVFENKKGNPLSLSIVYILVAQKVGIPIYGVNLPEHFILGYKNDINTFSFLNENQILFYVNAFNKGAIFSRKEIEQFLKNLKIELHEYYFNPCSNSDIIKRLVNNLVLAYEKLGYTTKVEELKKLFTVL